MIDAFRDVMGQLAARGEFRVRTHRQKWIVVLEDPSPDHDLEGMPRAFGEGKDVLDALEACLRNAREG